MLELFTPYLLFISFFITVLFNLWLVSKNTNWFVIIIANLLLILIMEFLGLAEYNFLNKIIELLLDLIGDIFNLAPGHIILWQRFQKSIKEKKRGNKLPLFTFLFCQFYGHYFLFNLFYTIYCYCIFVFFYHIFITFTISSIFNFFFVIIYFVY